MDAENYGLYFHFPFCLRRCRYCDFYSTERKLARIPAYVRALMREIEWTGAAGGSPCADSVFFGGGTPSLLEPGQLGRVLDRIRKSFRLDPQAEITLEANPGTVDRARLAAFRAAGVNRLSLGIQSADDGELRMLGRIHTYAEAEQACRDARRAGFANISLDLIYGLPGQTEAAWTHTLERALALGPEHLSLYALTLERGTELARAVRRGALPAPEDDAAAEMYERAEEMLAAAGYRHYEISNWARDASPAAGAESADLCVPGFPARACRHNLRYWLIRPYLGFGAGAHGCAAGKRYANIRSVEKFIDRIRTGTPRRFPLTPAASRSSAHTREDELREAMWLGLRLTEAGVSREAYRSRFGEDYCVRFRKEIDSSITDGLLEWTRNGEALRLTPRGRLLGNRVFQLFV
ncbi:MAG: radical SAM family heme chaperone HemW [Anaerolineales bacterium]|nr:radical SAM family heme chaperone HemW [Anaerolineales bacterium]